jgi:hypothetical protein
LICNKQLGIYRVVVSTGFVATSQRLFRLATLLAVAAHYRVVKQHLQVSSITKRIVPDSVPIELANIPGLVREVTELSYLSKTSQLSPNAMGRSAFKSSFLQDELQTGRVRYHVSSRYNVVD